MEIGDFSLFSCLRKAFGKVADTRPLSMMASSLVRQLPAGYDKDGKYWAFYVDGEYAATGVDSTDITAGATYTFKAE